MSAEIKPIPPPQPNIRQMLEGPQFKKSLAEALPKNCTPERFVRIAITALNRAPKLQQCSQTSLFKCLLDLSALGLEPDGRRAHLIPYGQECTLIIDYKGMIELAKRSGEVKLWRPQTVHENDKFTWNNGEISHQIDFLGDRGKLLAVYSHVINQDGIHDYEVMTVAECDKIKARSKAGSSGPWVNDYEAMCLKTVMRRHAKRLTLSPQFRDALEIGGDVIDIDNAPVTRAPIAMPVALPADEPEHVEEEKTSQQ